MKKILFLLAIMSAGVLMLSCSSKNSDGECNAELEKIQSYSTGELINYMYEGCDKKKDFNAISRILRASPSSLERLRTGETMPTPEFEAKVKDVASEYVRCGNSIVKLRVENDDMKWYEKNFHSKYIFSGVRLLYVLVLILACLIGLFLLVAYLVDKIKSKNGKGAKPEIDDVPSKTERNDKYGCGCGTLIFIFLIIALIMTLTLPQNTKDDYVDKIDNKIECQIIK